MQAPFRTLAVIVDGEVDALGHAQARRVATCFIEIRANLRVGLSPKRLHHPDYLGAKAEIGDLVEIEGPFRFVLLAEIVDPIVRRREPP